MSSQTSEWIKKHVKNGNNSKKKVEKKQEKDKKEKQDLWNEKI